MIYRTLFVLALSLLGPVVSQGHEVETCLMALAQRAEDLQACRVHQSSATECDALQQRLVIKAGQCRAAEHPEEAVNRAIAYGNSLVPGNPRQSPYQRQMTRERWEHSQMRPNVMRFEQLFTDYSQLQPDLTERFGTVKCPTAYEGGADRWIYRGPLALVRYSLDPAGPGTPEHRTLHLFSRELAGQCYPPQLDEGGNTYRVVNIPESLLQSLTARHTLIRCAGQDCTQERQATQERFQRYQGLYRRYRQLIACSDLVERNSRRGSVKGMRRSKIVLPEYCPGEASAARMMEARDQVEQLDQALFESANGLTNVTKAE